MAATVLRLPRRPADIAEPMTSSPKAPPVCRRCPFIDGDGRCELLSELTPQNAGRLLTEGACRPRDSIAATLRRSWPWLRPQQVDDLATDAQSELLILADGKEPEQITATFGSRRPNAYLFTQVDPPAGWAYRNLLRKHLRRSMRQRKREVLEAEPMTAQASHLDAPVADEQPLRHLLALDARSGLLMTEWLANGELDRDTWRAVLAVEDQFMPDDLPGVLAVARGERTCAETRERLDACAPRPESAVTNALTLARFKLCVLLTGTLDAIADANERAAFTLRHFTAGITTEAQAWASVRTDEDVHERYGTKQAWRAAYRRGAERALSALAETEGFSAAIRDAEVGFRRVLGLPPPATPDPASTDAEDLS